MKYFLAFSGVFRLLEGSTPSIDHMKNVVKYQCSICLHDILLTPEIHWDIYSASRRHLPEIVWLCSNSHPEMDEKVQRWEIRDKSVFDIAVKPAKATACFKQWFNILFYFL